jgi:hypothetical protein
VGGKPAKLKESQTGPHSILSGNKNKRTSVPEQDEEKQEDEKLEEWT